ncbi:proteinase inhibitor PSI-1.2 [Phoenix dactylifera]|uniref:Proteinase inhibitor PSI-1.2 n=1 Tax=Phoenix dactylifera TaxID=42345 RepID=A0A8B9ANM8_PHODC|nr:proteinase inhibitor PSI-1.2 [Phoenix dactylifera]
MACTRLPVVMLLLLTGTVLFGELQSSIGAVLCPQYCLDVDYMTCTSSGNKKLPSKCNCCLAPKGCTLHLSDGTELHCS